MLKMKAILALCLLSVALLSGCTTSGGYYSYNSPQYGYYPQPVRYGYTGCVNVRNYTNAPLIVERPCGGTNVIVPRSWR